MLAIFGFYSPQVQFLSEVDHDPKSGPSSEMQRYDAKVKLQLRRRNLERKKAALEQAALAQAIHMQEEFAAAQREKNCRVNQRRNKRKGN